MVRVEPSSAYQIGAREDRAEIADNDSFPQVAIRTTDFLASESGDTGRFVVTRSGPADDSLMVYVSVGGTSTFWDHFLTTGTVFFTTGQSSVTVTVRPDDDRLFEGIETVVLTIRPGVGYTVGPNQRTARVLILDNDRP